MKLLAFRKQGRWKDTTPMIRIIFYLKQQYIHLSRYFQAAYM